MITSQKELRREFWAQHPHFAEQARAAGIISKGQNEHCCTVRCTFVDWLDGLAKSGQVSDRFANRATL